MFLLRLIYPFKRGTISFKSNFAEISRTSTISAKKRINGVDTLNDNLCTELWYECEPKLRKICQIKLQNNPDEIDDVIAETFFALCSKAEANELPDNTNAWLYGAFNNILNKKYREIYKEKENRADLSGKKYKLPFDRNFEKEMLDKLSAEELKIKLDKELKDDEKLLLELIFIDKMKLREIAVRLNSTEAAIKQKKFRLVRKIRKTAYKKIF